MIALKLIKKIFFITIIFIGIDSFLYAQNIVPFRPRYDETLKGDILLIGNSILNREDGDWWNPGDGPNIPYNDGSVNSDFRMLYVDIDGDATTFSSSSANLALPTSSCSRIVYAGLYWGALINKSNPSNPDDPNDQRESFKNIKLKLPGRSSYNNITGIDIYNVAVPSDGTYNSYVCYADVTSLLQELTNPSGNYTVANVKSSKGYNEEEGTGLCAGWSLFIVYEDPTLTVKSITSFDGLTKVSGSSNQEITVSGFRTIPTGPVRATYAFSALEGDYSLSGDYLKINGTTISTPERPQNNFFKSAVTDLNGYSLSRNPNSRNTLGFDTGVMKIPNPASPACPGGCVIENGDTTASIELGSTQDIYFFYFNAFSTEVIAPDIVLSNIIKKTDGTVIDNGSILPLGEIVYYEVGYQNKGNDNATGEAGADITLINKLPDNVLFNLSDIDLTNSGGVTSPVYDATTRTITFKIPRASLEVGGPNFKIRIKVKVSENCNEFTNACSNIIKNQPIIKYSGVTNTELFEKHSISTVSSCNIADPSPTSFLADISICSYDRNEVICGSYVDIKGGNGYSSYIWSRSPSFSNPIGTSQVLRVTTAGVYYVRNIGNSECISLDEKITVTPFGTAPENPINAIADEVNICPDNGKSLPSIYLCGEDSSKQININISESSTITWEKLDETSCDAVANSRCANENISCGWSEIGRGQSFTVRDSGQYRVNITYSGGCYYQFYFNVYKNYLANLVAVPTNASCTTLGKITVGGVPGGYEYSINGGSYQASNIFDGLAVGAYTVRVKQAGVSGGCVFMVQDVQINNSELSISTELTQPLCHGDRGSVKVAASGAFSQYSYEISRGGTLVNSVNFISESDYTFSDLTSGSYQVKVIADGCEKTENAIITDVAALTVVANVRKPITSCSEGEIVAVVNGGEAPYNYSAKRDGTSISIDPGSPEIIIPVSGSYVISVLDANGCSASSSAVLLTEVSAPEYTVTTKNQLCYGNENTGIIEVGSISPRGNTLRYCIDYHLAVPSVPGDDTTSPPTPTTPEIPASGTWQDSPNFTGLAVGTYNFVVEYSVGNAVCYTTPMQIVINPATEITFDFTILQKPTCPDRTGRIRVNVPTGGVAPFETSVNGVDFYSVMSPYLFVNIPIGTGNIIMKDSKGCIAVSDDYVFSAPTEVILERSELIDIRCNPNKNINFVASGGENIKYTYITNLGDMSGLQDEGVFNDLPPASYLVRAENDDQCVVEEIFNIPELIILQVEVEEVKNVKCFGDSTGEVKFIVSGIRPHYREYDYYINGAIERYIPIIDGTTYEISIDNLAGSEAGTEYRIEIVDPDVSSCSSITTATVYQPAAALDFDVEQTPISCSANGSLKVTPSGGWGGVHSYKLTTPSGEEIRRSNSDSSTTFSITEVGDYEIRVEDSEGCQAFRTITFSAPIAPSAEISQMPCTPDRGGVNIIITSPTGFPGPNFEYKLNGATYQNSNEFANVPNGTHTIWVRDRNNIGCVFTEDVIVFCNNPPFVGIALNNDLGCGSNLSKATITVIGTNPPYTIEKIVDGVRSGTTTPIMLDSDNKFVVEENIAGTYKYEIVDSVGNHAETDPITITDPPNDLLAELEIKQVKCHGENNGKITVNASGGTAPYYYAFGTSGTTNPYQSSNVFTYLEEGLTYFINVKDSRECIPTEPVILATLSTPALDFDTEVTQFMCNSSNNTVLAKVTIKDASGGTAPYKYSLNGTDYYTNPVFSFAESQISTPSTSINNIYIKDANECVKNEDPGIVINHLPRITGATAVQTREITCIDPEIVEINTAGSSGPFSYSVVNTIDPPHDNPSNNIFTLSETGNYYFKVTDTSTSCFYDLPKYTVNPFNTARVILSNDTPIRCFGGETTMKVKIENYTGEYSYKLYKTSSGSDVEISNEPSENRDSFETTFVSVGEYVLEITETTSPFCTVRSNTLSLASPPEIQVTSIAAVRQPICPDNNGEISISATGGVGGLKYQLSSSTTPVVVPYQSNGNFTGLTSGSYTIKVKDASDCVFEPTDVITLTAPIGISATVGTSTPVLQCSGDVNGSIEINNVAGGQGFGYTCTLETIPPHISRSVFLEGSLGGVLFSDLGKGNYMVKIRDSWHCEYEERITITEPDPVTASLTLTSSPTCITPATITLAAAGGTPPYDYYTSSPGTSEGGFNPEQLITVPRNISPEVREYFVKDSNDCWSFISNKLEINPATPPGLSYDLTNSIIFCRGETTAEIKVNASGGLGNYYYTLLNSSDVVIRVSSPNNIIADIGAGNYKVKVTSEDCETTGETIMITEPDTVFSSVLAREDAPKCFGGNNGEIEVVGSGGTPDIQYAISPKLNKFVSTGTFSELSGNTPYTIITQDRNGCFHTYESTLIPPEELVGTVVPGSVHPDFCVGELGSFAIDIAGGIRPYNITLDNIDGDYIQGYSTQTQFVFGGGLPIGGPTTPPVWPGLSGGDHVVYIKDQNDCVADISQTLQAPLNLASDLKINYFCVNNIIMNEVVYNLTNPGLSNDKISYSLSETGPYQASPNFSNLMPGNYIINIKSENFDGSFCSNKSPEIIIEDIKPVSVSLEQDKINLIDIKIDGGFSPFEIIVNGQPNTENPIPYFATATFKVDVTDVYGCTATDTKDFQYIDVRIPNVFTPNGDGINETWAPINTGNYKNMIVIIFDRYGRKLRTMKQGESWNGEYNGEGLPSGDYWYVLKLKHNLDDREFVGNFTLYR